MSHIQRGTFQCIVFTILFVFILLFPKLSRGEEPKGVLPALKAIGAALESTESDQGRRAELERGFYELATGLTLDGNQPEPERSLSDEVQGLLKPLVEEFGRITERPRQVSTLKSHLEMLDEKETAYKAALEKVKDLIKEASESTVLARLEQILRQLITEIDFITAEKAVITQRLELLQGNDEGIAINVAKGAQRFFSTRGMNLLIAFTVTFLVLLLFRFLRVMVTSLPRRSAVKYSNNIRMLSIFYLIGSVVGSCVAFFFTLFVLQDWLLLSIATLIFIGIVWASKETLPRYWSQVVMLMNMGAVREGERIEYQGLPYQVSTLGLYSTLVNPELTGELKLPINDLLDLRSRIAKNESWFPTKEGDVVLLDSLVGEIIAQGKDLVSIKFLGGAIRTIPSRAFLSFPIQNLSNGFRLEIPFLVGFTSQEMIINGLPGRFQSLVEALLADYSKDIFVRSAINSVQLTGIEVMLFVDLPGYLAKEYHDLKQEILTVLVEFCAKNDVELPINQLQLKMSPEQKVA